jgi:hypothetical protein
VSLLGRLNDGMLQPMRKRPSLATRGRHTVLPIEGSLLAEVCLAIDRLVALVFRDAVGNEAEVTVEDKIVLARGTDEHVLEGSRPGQSFDPRGLRPLLDLLGCRVCEAIAQDTGELRVTFANGLVWRLLRPPVMRHGTSLRPGRGGRSAARGRRSG